MVWDKVRTVGWAIWRLLWVMNNCLLLTAIYIYIKFCIYFPPNSTYFAPLGIQFALCYSHRKCIGKIRYSKMQRSEIKIHRTNKINLLCIMLTIKIVLNCHLLITNYDSFCLYFIKWVQQSFENNVIVFIL